MERPPQVVLMDVPADQARQVRALASALGLEAVTRSRSVAEVGSLSIDLEQQTVRLGERDVKLTPQEFALLACLARVPGSFVSRERLFADAWGRDQTPSRTVDVHVRRLRAKLGDRAI